MIPSVIARQVQRGVEDFLLTTFRITNPFFAGALERLLSKPGQVFRGPYLSIKLPFVQGAGSDRWFPDIIPESFQPYRHQQQAFERLDWRSAPSTIVATGTGSGKTECFLFPILDYCWRNRGRRGIKAILIYPMNALATDQARRLAKMIFRNPELRGYITAGLYLGGREETPVPIMGEEELITDRNILRQAPPDILLTNYKMLDYLLVRPRDFPLWRRNQPETLKYLVVDELHTFDGAQGADLACLIRRIKERLETPPGLLCCVGTSATLGEGALGFTAEELVDCATRLFGEPFDKDAIIGESLQSPEEFLKGCLVTRFQVPSAEQTEAMDPLGYEAFEDYLQAQYRLWLGQEMDAASDGWRLRLGEALQGHAFLRNLLTILGNRAVDVAQLQEELRKQLPGFRDRGPRYLNLVLSSFLCLVSEARNPGPVVDGKPAEAPLVQVRYQLWLRELRRMVAPVQKNPELAFADDLKFEELKRSLPVIHCRECGLTGWAGTVKDADTRVNPDLQTFYNSYFAHSPHVVFLYPQVEKERDGQRTIPLYLCTSCLNIQRMTEPGCCVNCGAGFDRLLSMWAPDTNRTVKLANGHERREGVHDCPSCGGYNSLTILGSRSVSLTSVIIAQLFSSPFNSDKKLLAFSDSVQDASHRAGFFSARTYTFNLRSALQKAVQAQPEPPPFAEVARLFLEHWKQRLSGEDFIATFLPPDMNWLDDYEYLRKNGRLPGDSNLLQLVEKRLDWEIWSEYTFGCRIGRTLEKTGASTLGGHFKTGHRGSLQNRPTDQTPWRTLFTLPAGGLATQSLTSPVGSLLI
jgi:DEAD/DEAH box helicase domain-containing protein